MSEENLLYNDSSSDFYSDLTADELQNLHLVMEELKGWDTQNLERVLSTMANDSVYHDITLPPARGLDEIRKFGESWLGAAPDFHVSVEKFVVHGDDVVTMGKITGTIKGEYFGLAATGKRFECMFCQVAVVKRNRIAYVRDHWDSITMAKQVGWVSK